MPETRQYWEVLFLDVWGNPDDGYDINQAFYTGKVLEISETASNRDILLGLPDCLTNGFNCEHDYIDDCDTLLTFYDSSDSDTPGKPYLQLQLLGEYRPFDPDKFEVIGVIE